MGVAVAADLDGAYFRRTAAGGDLGVWHRRLQYGIRIAATIPTYGEEGDALEQAIASVRPFVDTVITLPGAIAGAVPGAVDGDGTSWPSQSAKRTWLLELARRAGATWALMLDSDEQLHNGQTLRGMLERWPYSTRPLIFEHFPGVPQLVAWKLLRLIDWQAFVAQSYYLQSTSGVIYRLDAERVEFDSTAELRELAWISHHPGRRPSGRAQIRLGPLEHELEPPPPPAVAYVMPAPLAIAADPSMIAAT